MQIPKFLTSSVDPEKMALTVKGFLTGLVPVIIFISGLNHINVGQDDLNNIIDAVSGLVMGIGGAISAFMVAWGVIRKVLVNTGFYKV